MPKTKVKKHNAIIAQTTPQALTPDYSLTQAIAQIAHPKKRVFLECLYATRNISKSARTALINRRTVYDWLENDPQFKEIYNNQLMEMLDDGKAKLINNALNAKGKEGVTELIFFLKSMHPDFKPAKESIAFKDNNIQFVISRG